VESAAREEKEEARSEFEAWKNELFWRSCRKAAASSFCAALDGRPGRCHYLESESIGIMTCVLTSEVAKVGEGMEILVDYDRASSSQPRLRLISSRSVRAPRYDPL